MILVFYGTREARNLIQKLKEENYTVYAAVVTQYGKELALEFGAKEVLTGGFDEMELRKLIVAKRIKVIVDGAHPFSEGISQLAQEICQELGIGYIRYERESLSYPESPLIHHVGTIEEAAIKASELGQVIFLTTGSHNLDNFIQIAKQRKRRVVVRVIPEHQIVKKCRDLGLAPKDIIAMQGPFSVKTNKALLQAVKADVLVTKDSGKGGGADTKISAALSLKLPIVLLTKKQNSFPNKLYSLDEVLSKIRNIVNK